MGYTRLREHRSDAIVWINGDRQARPNLPSAGCPFCPGGLEAPEPYDILWFPNRWPALPDDRCEVILYTPRHDASFWSIGVDGVEEIIEHWTERTQVLGKRNDVEFVLPFENRGREVGATIDHPHGQLYAFDTVPPVMLTELSMPKCPICMTLRTGYIVSEYGGWWAVIPEAARYPFELMIAPVDHVPDLMALIDDDREAMAWILVDVLSKLDKVFKAPMPYMLWVHQRPTDGGDWPQAHVHVEIAPYYRAPGLPRYVAAAELATGIWLNPLEPAKAADKLRSA